MAKRRHDPFFTHLWDELVGTKLLQSDTFSKWAELPAKLQGQFVEAAKRAMNAALGAPVKPRRPARKVAKKAKAKAKTKSRKKAANKRKKG